MDKLYSLQFPCLFLTVSTLVFNISGYAEEEERQVYIVYMGALLQQEEYSILSYHTNMLQQVVHPSFVRRSLVRSYSRSFNAFAANLTNKERDALASFKEVVSIFPSRTLRTQTTRSWDFMGFPKNVDRKLTIESNIVVGVIDTGIWPESQSFNDEGFGPPPKKWKGVCNGGKNFTCNRKLIGARYYGSDSARDKIGHGTHTASTATGREVKDISFYGLGQGTARGAVPSARIAAYKVCFGGCPDTAILAAFDDAIADGVDIISISLSDDDAFDIIHDSVAIGAFHAMQKGILTVQSAGNNGPGPGVIRSVAPWLFTVGASSIDRLFTNKVGLGNGKIIKGLSIDTFKRGKAKFPLVYGIDVSSTCNELDSQKCNDGCLNSSLVKNKIVVCNRLVQSSEAYLAGAAGLVGKTPSNYPPFIVPFPESFLTHCEFDALLNYINSTKQAGGTPIAYISATKSIRDRHAPRVSSFSARGPNPIFPNILKPDVTAPGADILAAYSPTLSPTYIDADKRHVNYSIESGTSMSCPHVSGVAAYVKSFHPNWSPAAIKSALMTTAWNMKKRKTVDNEFAYGAGHINPVTAINPGLVYDISSDDYIKLLCGLGYNTTVLRQITGHNNSSSCADKAKTKHIDLNYPSMAAKVDKNKAFSVKFSRRVTNVGHAKSKYKVKINKHSNISVVVKPRILRFKELNERKSFIVSVKGMIHGANTVTASIKWSDGIHKVRSPIVVYDDSAYNASAPREQH